MIRLRLKKSKRCSRSEFVFLRGLVHQMTPGSATTLSAISAREYRCLVSVYAIRVSARGSEAKLFEPDESCMEKRHRFCMKATVCLRDYQIPSRRRAIIR